MTIIRPGTLGWHAQSHSDGRAGSPSNPVQSLAVKGATLRAFSDGCSASSSSQSGSMVVQARPSFLRACHPKITHIVSVGRATRPGSTASESATVRALATGVLLHLQVSQIQWHCKHALRPSECATQRLMMSSGRTIPGCYAQSDSDGRAGSPSSQSNHLQSRVPHSEPLAMGMLLHHQASQV